MLKLKIFGDKNLDIPEMELQADDVIDLLTPYLDKIKIELKKDVIEETLTRKRFIKIGINVKEDYKYQKKYYNYCFLAKYLVENNKAMWLEYDADLLEPANALRALRRKLVPNDEKSKEKRIAARKAFLTNLTPEDKKKHFSYLTKESNQKALTAMKTGVKSFWNNLNEKEKQDFLEKRALKIKQGKSKKNVYPEPIKIELDLPFE